MTDAPSLPAQMDKVRWHIEYWKSRNLNDHAQEMCDVLVTLQQHERLVTEIAEMEAGYKNAAELVLTYHGKNERLEAVVDQLRWIADQRRHGKPAGETAWNQLWDNLAALDTAAPDNAEDAERDV